MIHSAVLISAYVIVWFLALFCLLPMGVGSEVDPNSGAPLKPRFGLKVMLATSASAVLWAVFYALVYWNVIGV